MRTQLVCLEDCGFFGTLNQVEIAELASTEQEIHVIVTPTTKPPWLLSAIYASPRYAERRLLWENLESMANLFYMPWEIAGDINEVLMGEDKFGGCSVNISRALRLQDCLNNCRMIGIGYLGPRFTWSNHRPLSQLVQGRIDKVFVNAEWNSQFYEADVLHLEKSHSDHCPIKLCFEKEGVFNSPSPFVSNLCGFRIQVFQGW